VSVGVESVRYLYALDDRAIVTGDKLVDAVAQLDPLTNAPTVNFELDRAGGRRFSEETGRHIGDYMAIILDNEVQGRPPVIEDRIGRSGRITLGGRTIEEARDLALTLKAGALPIPLKIVEEGQVGASLGQDAVQSGIIAGIIGSIFALAAIMTLIAPMYQCKRDYLAALKVSAHGASPLLLSGVTLVLPVMVVVSMFALCYTLFLYYVGATTVLEIRRDQAEFIGISMLLLTFVSMMAGMAAASIGLI